mmetsp:Transcript_11254/g.33981  ORF Transcript_11254/g.33981 Transcript_11254/m.33981 type:complete len:253 (+) Transcript_11254:165-923(+)
MLEVVRPQPDVDRLRREAAVREREHGLAAGLEDARDFFANRERLRQIIDRHDVRDDVEGIIFKRQDRLLVQVLDHVRVDLAVLLELLLVHAERDALPREVGDVRGKVRDVRRANVQDGGFLPLPERRPVKIRQRRDGRVVDVEAEARHVVKSRIRRLVAAREVARRVRPVGGPFGRLEHVRDADGVQREAAHRHDGQRLGARSREWREGARHANACRQQQRQQRRGAQHGAVLAVLQTCESDAPRVVRATAV